MKNLLLFLLSVIYMYGDTLDNMILEQLRQEKLENENGQILIKNIMANTFITVIIE